VNQQIPRQEEPLAKARASARYIKLKFKEQHEAEAAAYYIKGVVCKEMAQTSQTFVSIFLIPLFQAFSPVPVAMSGATSIYLAFSS
jgi:hypothetical protein